MADDPKGIFDEHLRKSVEAAKRADAALAVIYREITRRVKASIKKRGDNVTVFEVRAQVDREFAATLKVRVKAIEKAVDAGAAEGPKAAVKTAEIVERSTQASEAEKRTAAVIEAAQPIRVEINATKKSLKAASEKLAARTKARPRVPISTRVRAWDEKLASEMAREVEAGIRQKRGIIGAAREIQKLDKGRVVELPKYLQQVEAAARKGDMAELKQLTSKWTAWAREHLGEIQADATRKASQYSLRSATERFLRDIEKAGAEGIDKVVDKYIAERAQYHARLIARHETVQAMRRTYVEETKDKPGVVAFRWQLSPTRHKVRDICDVFANANRFGLGPGIYPADHIPEPHPACICATVAVIDRQHFRRARDPSMGPPLEDKQSPDAMGWLVNAADGKQIVGPTRWVAAKAGVNVFDQEGQLLPVAAVLDKMPSAAHAAE